VLARRAKLEVLQPEEEISSFAVALVVKGDVGIVPAVSDIPCGYAQKGDVIFTRGSLAGGIALSVVAGLTALRSPPGIRPRSTSPSATRRGSVTNCSRSPIGSRRWPVRPWGRWGSASTSR
jgi:hypothetical protein